MGYDPLSPALYTYNKDNEGNIDSVQSHTILGSGHVSFLFKKNVPGMWFTQQGDEVAPFFVANANNPACAWAS